MNTSHFNPSQTGWYSIYLLRRDGRLNWPRLLVTYQDGLPAHRRSHIQVLTWLGVELATCWSQVRRPDRYTTKPPQKPTFECFSFDQVGRFAGLWFTAFILSSDSVLILLVSRDRFVREFRLLREHPADTYHFAVLGATKIIGPSKKLLNSDIFSI